MIRRLLSLGVLCLGLSPGRAAAELVTDDDGVEWIRITSCGPARGWGWEAGTGGSLEEVQQYSQMATRVRMCTDVMDADTAECVTSRLDTYPIQNLRRGQLPISHVGGVRGQPCGTQCVQETWTGPRGRLANLVVRRANLESEIAGTMNWFYHAAGNGGAIHFGDDDGGGHGHCSWTYNPRNRERIVVYVDRPTLSPSSTPTSQPTDWYQHPGHALNISTMQETISELEHTVRAQAQTITQLVNQTAFASRQREVGGRLDALEEAMRDGVAVDLAIMGNVTSLQNNVTTLSGALRAALTAATAVVDPPRAPPLPAVTATGSGTMKLSAPSAIQLHSDRCLVTDLCDAVAFAARLEVALDGI